MYIPISTIFRSEVPHLHKALFVQSFIGLGDNDACLIYMVFYIYCKVKYNIEFKVVLYTKQAWLNCDFAHFQIAS